MQPSTTQSFASQGKQMLHAVLQLKNSRKEVANLLRTGKAENARIRVETVMREEAMLQAYDGGPSSVSFASQQFMCCRSAVAALCRSRAPLSCFNCEAHASALAFCSKTLVTCAWTPRRCAMG